MMKKHPIKLLLAVFCLMFTLQGCESLPAPEGKPLPSLTFAHMQTLNLNVNSVQVSKELDGRFIESNIGGSFPTPPDIALDRYLNQRFAPARNFAPNSFVFTIRHASLTRALKQSPNRFFKAIKVDQLEEYTLRYELVLEHISAQGRPLLSTVMQYEKSRDLPRSLSLAELEEEYMVFVEEIIQELDQAIVTSLQNNFRLLNPEQGEILPRQSSTLAPERVEQDPQQFFLDLNRSARESMAPVDPRIQGQTAPNGNMDEAQQAPTPLSAPDEQDRQTEQPFFRPSSGYRPPSE